MCCRQDSISDIFLGKISFRGLSLKNVTSSAITVASAKNRADDPDYDDIEIAFAIVVPQTAGNVTTAALCRQAVERREPIMATRCNSTGSVSRAAARRI
jgi:hypothetical protein